LYFMVSHTCYNHSISLEEPILLRTVLRSCSFFCSCSCSSYFLLLLLLLLLLFMLLLLLLHLLFLVNHWKKLNHRRFFFTIEPGLLDCWRDWGPILPPRPLELVVIWETGEENPAKETGPEGEGRPKDFWGNTG